MAILAMRLSFTKYEGLGNDVLVFDVPPGRLGLTRGAMTRFIRAAAHRNLGIGADEIAFVSADRRGRTVARIVFYNADGSRARMCGNGMRCVALHVFELGLTGGKRAFRLGTDAGPRLCRILASAREGAARVSVEMGTARPLRAAAKLLEDTTITAGGDRLRAVTVSMGNPHVVTFGRRRREDMRRIGIALQRSRRFPGGVNVGFAVPRGRSRIDLVVWERGCGFTMACGSGACAAAAAGARLGLAAFDRPLHVRLPGGTLDITVFRDFSVLMTGPARRVFRGTLDDHRRPAVSLRMKLS